MDVLRTDAGKVQTQGWHSATPPQQQQLQAPPTAGKASHVKAALWTNIYTFLVWGCLKQAAFLPLFTSL